MQMKSNLVEAALTVLVFSLPQTMWAQADDKNVHINKEAVNAIRFDFGKQTETPFHKQSQMTAADDKKWLRFKMDLRVPRNWLDSTKVSKPDNYVRANPYTIFTHFGEDPVYDVLVTGRPQKMEMTWGLNKNATFEDEYGKSILPSPGKMYELLNAGGNVKLFSLTFDFDKLLYENLTKRGRYIKYNRTHANAWKTYANYMPTKADTDKFPHLTRSFPTIAAMDSTRPPGTSAPVPTLSTPSPAPSGAHTAQSDTVIPPTIRHHRVRQPREAHYSSIYEEMREKQRQDSIQRARILRIDGGRQNVYDIEKQIRQIKNNEN